MNAPQDEQVTVDFHKIKCWIDRNKAVPAMVSKDGQTYPSIILEEKPKEGVEQVALSDFFNMMINQELAFKYNKEMYEFVSQEDYIDSIEDLW